MDILNDLLALGKNTAIGLDIGTSAIRMVQIADDGGGLAVEAAAIEAIEADQHDDEALKVANTAAAIKRCYKKLGAKTKYVVCGVSGPEVAARGFNLPAVAPDRLEVAIVAEAADVCPFNVRQNRFDYQLAAPASHKPDTPQGGHTGIMVAATNVIVNDRKNLAERAGLHCALMDVNGLAMLNLFDACEKPPVGRTVVLLNVGANSVNMVITSDTTLPFVRDSSHGADAIVAQIAQEKNIPSATVRAVLVGANKDPENVQVVAQGMRSGCGRLARDISETLRYHMTQERSGPVETVYICGGFSLAVGFAETMGSLLNLEGRLWDPFKKIRHAAGSRGLEILEEKGPAFVVAAGLGMRTI